MRTKTRLVSLMVNMLLTIINTRIIAISLKIIETNGDEINNTQSIQYLHHLLKPNMEESHLETVFTNFTSYKEQESTHVHNTTFLNTLGENYLSTLEKVKNNIEEKIQQKQINDAINYGLNTSRELAEVKEKLWYQMGLYLNNNDPALRLAAFGKPNEIVSKLSKFGFAALEANKKIVQSYPEEISRQSFPIQWRQLLLDDCPWRGNPICPSAARKYRTADGTCNNFKEPWQGSSNLPMQRFLPPIYENGIESIRQSVLGGKLPSPRDVSIKIHKDENRELQVVTLMLMQWGQFIDHDIISSPKSLSFNGSVPRCCGKGGLFFLPSDLLHPNCLPIEVSPNDWFFAQFGIRCLEFVRSAPSTTINCDLGWREQINQVTSYLDGSVIYGTDARTSDSLRTFRNGKLQYGIINDLNAPDSIGSELCRSGALSVDCFQSGDGRISEQPGLTALHTIWLRYHNKLATVLTKLNNHWSDEKIFQETRKIIGAVIQHITYREFLPLVLGQEVMDLFELNLETEGYYKNYNESVNPAIANSFATAAFRFGHSLVQNSFIRFDKNHRPLFGNVSLHEESENIENIWSTGSIDRLLLGFSNQKSQKRDEFICDELTNHLFQPPNLPFGLDLAAINIQRGRDHGIPPYTSWRKPCGLLTITTWSDLRKSMKVDAVQHFKSIYKHVDDIDLFSGGLAEKSVRGGLVGPTFACIIAQQFLNLRRGDRFWYENGGFTSSFTPDQLHQIRQITFAHVLCQTLGEIETIQPFVFLVADDFRNARVNCNIFINHFDLISWIQQK